MFALYSILLTVGFLRMLPLFLLRRDKYAAGFRQRFGRIPELRQNNRSIIWIHCVSVGETNAAVPLIKAIKEEYPDFRIVISTTTKTGQELAHKLFTEIADLIFYFPFDWKFTVRRALKKIKPNVVLLMETEIWFNFIREAKAGGANVFIVNGRLSEKSSDRYLKIRKLMSRVLRFVDVALMQTNADAQRILRLGINANKVRVTGNIKYDQSPVEKNSIFVSYFTERFDISPKNPLIVAASTHAPEERWILEAFKEVYKSRAENLPRLLLAPRHPERFDEVAELVKNSGLKLVRRSSPLHLEDVSADVILLDSIGELRQVFSLAEIVFVGGSLIPHGGQNILEPAIAKKAIVTGFYTMNFAGIVKTFEENEAVIRLPELKENEISAKLAEMFDELLQSDEKRLKLAENAFKMLEKNRGATAKMMKFMRPVLQVQATKNFVSGKPANTFKSEPSL
ncbi:3-deoxy-D-manno-octulosonic acid transferase [soil metagenome]